MKLQVLQENNQHTQCVELCLPQCALTKLTGLLELLAKSHSIVTKKTIECQPDAIYIINAMNELCVPKRSSTSVTKQQT